MPFNFIALDLKKYFTGSGTCIGPWVGFRGSGTFVAGPSSACTSTVVVVVIVVSIVTSSFAAARGSSPASSEATVHPSRASVHPSKAFTRPSKASVPCSVSEARFVSL